MNATIKASDKGFVYKLELGACDLKGFRFTLPDCRKAILKHLVRNGYDMVTSGTDSNGSYTVYKNLANGQLVKFYLNPVR